MSLAPLNHHVANHSPQTPQQQTNLSPIPLPDPNPSTPLLPSSSRHFTQPSLRRFGNVTDQHPPVSSSTFPAVVLRTTPSFFFAHVLVFTLFCITATLAFLQWRKNFVWLQMSCRVKNSTATSLNSDKLIKARYLAAERLPKATSSPRTTQRPIAQNLSVTCRTQTTNPQYHTVLVDIQKLSIFTWILTIGSALSGVYILLVTLLVVVNQITTVLDRRRHALDTHRNPAQTQANPLNPSTSPSATGQANLTRAQTHFICNSFAHAWRDPAQDWLCAICLAGSDEPRAVIHTVILPCSHRFHRMCIRAWLRRGKSICPLCQWDVRQVLIPVTGYSPQPGIDKRAQWEDGRDMSSRNVPVHVGTAHEQTMHLYGPTLGLSSV